MFSKLVPGRFKRWFQWQVRSGLQKQPPVSFQKFIPYQQQANAYQLSKGQRDNQPMAADGFPYPPAGFMEWLSNTPAEYVDGGKLHLDQMLTILEHLGFKITNGMRVLDMGCGAGRMLRHLATYADKNEIWGTDINGPQVTWAKMNLHPAFRVFTSTTLPHLPFKDDFFDLIFCGSVFTHIDDLAEAWLCELRRLLKPGGKLYITIHDNHTIKLLGTEEYKDHYFTKQLAREPLYAAHKDDFKVMVFGRDVVSNVFYDRDYLQQLLHKFGFNVLSVNNEAYAFQTAYLCEKQLPQ